MFVVFMVIISTIAVIYNAFHISVVQRIKHFGLMQAIGLTKKQLRGLVLREATYISLISIPFGLLFGTLAFAAVTFVFSHMGEGGEFSNLQLVLSPKVYMISSCVGIARSSVRLFCLFGWR